MRKTELHGETLRVGDKVVLAFGSGNRDGRKFPDPGHFRYRPPAAGPPRLRLRQAFLSRRQMARLVTEVAMRRFLERVPDYHLTVTSRLEFVVELPQPDGVAVRRG